MKLEYGLEYVGPGRYYVRGSEGGRYPGVIIGSHKNWTVESQGIAFPRFKTKKLAAEYLHNITVNQRRFWKGELCE